MSTVIHGTCRMGCAARPTFVLDQKMAFPISHQPYRFSLELGCKCLALDHRTPPWGFGPFSKVSVNPELTQAWRYCLILDLSGKQGPWPPFHPNATSVKSRVAELLR
jgi:hypothetical protein